MKVQLVYLCRLCECAFRVGEPFEFPADKFPLVRPLPGMDGVQQSVWHKCALGHRWGIGDLAGAACYDEPAKKDG